MDTEINKQDLERFLTILSRIDERVKHLSEKLDKLVDKAILKDEFHAELRPIRAVSYGLVSIIMIGVLGAMLAMIIK